MLVLWIVLGIVGYLAIGTLVTGLGYLFLSDHLVDEFFEAQMVCLFWPLLVFVFVLMGSLWLITAPAYWLARWFTRKRPERTRGTWD